MKPGSIGWVDLTVADADSLRDFYADVVGWTVQSTAMGEYDDYTMLDGEGKAVSGVCHARGENASQPPGWLIYVIVEDLDRSIERCRARGGEVVRGPVAMGAARYCVIRDPAGAFCGLYMAAPES